MISGRQNRHCHYHLDREPLSQTLLVGKHGPCERWVGQSHLWGWRRGAAPLQVTPWA